MNGFKISGPGYSVLLSGGFNILNGDPYTGAYWLLPPGSQAFDVPALVQIRPVQPVELPMLLQNLYQFDNPFVAMANAANLGLAKVTAILPIRQLPLSQGSSHIREFEAITIRGFPARVMVVVIQGAVSAVEVVILINLYRWTEFIAPCLEFIGSIDLAGSPPPPGGEVVAVIDQNNRDQVEYRLVNPDRSTVPITSLPASVGNTIIVNIDHSIKVGNISGTGVVVGNHSHEDSRPVSPENQDQTSGGQTMENQGGHNINIGNVTGTGIAIGANAHAEVKITQETREEIGGLIQQLRSEIENASIPDGSRHVLLNKAMNDMDQAMQADDPTSGLERGLERINDQLEGLGATTDKVSGIVQTVTKIAKSAGIVIKHVAPFLASLL